MGDNGRTLQRRIVVSSLNTPESLRTVYREPTGAPLDKVIHQLDDHCRDFLAKSPFMVLSTAADDGTVDGSPKGGEPGFAQVLHDGRVAWADSSGNNRLDSFENIVRNPKVALLFMIPGLAETLRINGTASLETDPVLCELLSLGGRPAKVVVTVVPDEAYVHCAKAFRRASLWEPETWLAADERPDGLAMIQDHAAINDVPLEKLQTMYDDDVEATMWRPGGGLET